MVSLLDVADPKNLKDILNLIDAEVSDRIPVSQIMSELDTEVLNLLPTSGVMFEYVSTNIADVQNNINQTQTDLDATKDALTTKVNISDITNIIQSAATTNKLPTDAAVVNYVEALIADLSLGEYTAGNGIDIIDDVISVKQSVLDNIDSKISVEKITNSMLNTELTDKLPTESAVAEYVASEVSDFIPVSQIMTEVDTEVLNLLPTSGVMFEYVSTNITNVQNSINQTQTDLDATKTALTTKVNVSDITSTIQSTAVTNKLPTDTAVVNYVEALLADLPSDEYVEGTGIDITNKAISVEQSVLDNIDSKISAEKITNSMLNTELTDKIPTESAVAEYVDSELGDVSAVLDAINGEVI